MDQARPAADRESRFDGLHDEAQSALGFAANTLRAIRDRYREAVADERAAWQAVRDDIDAAERRPRPGAGDTDPAAAAEAGAEDGRIRALRNRAELLGSEVGIHQRELARLDLALRNLERTWLFVERDDASLVTEAGESLSADVRMQLVEAQESERSRLAQEVHDGPAQALTNAIFQVEYIERVITRDVRLARTELRYLRELLRRELGDVRSFISQLRPPVLDDLGLDGAVADAASMAASLIGIPVETQLDAPADRLAEAHQTVVLRIVQEALQNVRKHAGASRVTIATSTERDDWIVEVKDDGRGFDVGAVAARGRRNFGLQFMRERAELVGARFEVRSRPDGGTIVRLAIPLGAEESR